MSREKIEENFLKCLGNSKAVYEPKKEIIKEAHKWLNDKFNGKGIEVRIIDWSKNEVNNYSPVQLIEEYAKYQQEQDKNKFSEEEIRFIKGMISLYWMDNNSEHPINFKEVELSNSIIKKIR